MFFGITSRVLDIIPCAYGDEKALSIPQVQHMMYQASNIFNGNPEFISLIFDMFRRRGTSTGVAATIRNDPDAIAQRTLVGTFLIPCVV